MRVGGATLTNGPPFVLLGFVAIPITIGVLTNEPGEKYNKFLALGAFQLLFFAFLVSFFFE